MIDFLFLDEGICYSCKKEEIYKYHLCQKCLDKLDYIGNSFKLSDNICYSLYFYNDFMKKLIADYKFNRNTCLKDVFSDMLYSFLVDNDLTDFDYILASPSSRKTVNKRGFDHIKLIVDSFSDKLEIRGLDEFKKVKNTKSQHTLNRLERNENLKGAFSLDKDINGSRILLIDDLITTGNTALEIIKELKKRGASEVVTLAICSERSVN